MRETLEYISHRFLAESSEYDNHGCDCGAHGEEHFGVHIEFMDLYMSVVFFTAIFVAGKAAAAIKMPALVGEILIGLILGPNLLDVVPNAEAFVMLGEIGLILLVVEAGIDINLTTLSLIGARGVTIAIIGSILPIAIGIAIAFAIGTDVKGSIAAGSAFGPTSLGIAMNILRSAKIVNTPVGQLIVAAAIIDDMIALILLSQLNALTGEFSVATVLTPIVSALGFLILGGYLAIFQIPKVLDRFVFSKVADESKHGPICLGIMFGFVLLLMPATKYAQASYLMGCFIAGLVFCSNHHAHVHFVSQLKRLMQWLLRIFFAAVIGFQVPVKEFANGKVIGYGILFTMALLGKLAVGFLVPNFTQSPNFKGFHLRDVMVVGFSMAAEGEFAFVIAVFAFDKKLISKELYSSIVLAVLLSTILAPFALRMTISAYNKVAEKRVEDAEKVEMERLDHDGDGSWNKETTVFLCIQTQSDSAWGLLPRIITCINKMHLEIIDHRSWNPRGVHTTLINEVYVKDSMSLDPSIDADEALDARLEEVQSTLINVINQDYSKVKGEV